jgi:hypothetical protein
LDKNEHEDEKTPVKCLDSTIVINKEPSPADYLNLRRGTFTVAPKVAKVSPMVPMEKPKGNWHIFCYFLRDNKDLIYYITRLGS